MGTSDDFSGARGQAWPPGRDQSGARQKIKSKSDGSGDLEERSLLRRVGLFEETRREDYCYSPDLEDQGGEVSLLDHTPVRAL